MRATRSELAATRLARLREQIYALLAHAFLSPDPARLAGLARDARRLRRRASETTVFAFAAAWRSLLDELADARLDCGALQAAYVGAFVPAGPDTVCPPFESAYGVGGQGALLASLEREYREAGLAPSPDAAATPDHAAVELEYMAYLCDGEARAWEREPPVEVARLQARQLAFLDAHLSRWLPSLAERLAAAPTHAAYAALGRASWAFVVHDRDLVGLLCDVR